MSRRIALFGGSFDPPHVGHQMVALWLLATRRADEVWVVPCGSHPFGKVLAPFRDRVEMAEAAFAPLRPFGTIRVEPIESTLPAPTYTIDTVTALKKAHPDAAFLLVVGTDLLADAPKWKEWSRLQSLVEILVVRRAGADGSDVDPDPEHPSPLFPPVSSTEIRARLGRGADVKRLVPTGALQIAEARRLYS